MGKKQLEYHEREYWYQHHKKQDKIFDLYITYFGMVLFSLMTILAGAYLIYAKMFVFGGALVGFSIPLWFISFELDKKAGNMIVKKYTNKR